MPTDERRFLELAEGWITGDLSADEERFFLNLLEEPPFRALLEKVVAEDMAERRYEGPAIPEVRDRLQTFIASHIQPPMQTRSFRLVRLAAAAAVLLLVAAGTYWLLIQNRTNSDANKGSLAYKNDLAPGTNKALLTLANGNKIILDSAANGLLAHQGNTKIEKLTNGELAYRPGGIGEKGIFNTLSTPRGGQYRLVLPDGSRVWLNAASSIRYPTAFTGSERVVELSGEAYFEIAANPAMPFRVGSGATEIQVLGTHFDVQAYPEEEGLSTTLLQGSVQVVNAGHRALLVPGQQAITRAGTIIEIRKEADTAQAVAWKNGYFQFTDAPIETIMRQISRWYDVDIEYLGDVRSLQFGAVVSRRAHVSEVLHFLELTGVVHFQIEGRKITVLPGKQAASL